MLTLMLQSLRNRLFSVSLTIMVVAISVALFIGVELVRTQTKQSFANTISGTDLVVDSLTATGSAITVTIRNAGSMTVDDAFWVDVYFNPGQTPGLN